MIELTDVTKTFYTRGIANTIVRNLSLKIEPDQSVALIGRNGVGKSSLLKIIAGTLKPTKGRVKVNCNVSWPVGLSGGFHGELPGYQNTRFVARICGVDADELTNLVYEETEIGKEFFLPLGSYSSGMRARLGFAVSMGISFDIYLIDEATSVGDDSFKRKCERLLNDRLKDSGSMGGLS